jgi:serine/threonine-protein kinase
VRVSTTREGGLKGKLRYMAPEQVADEEVSRRTDVYAASVVLWELLVGEPLFRASNEAAWMARITEGIVVAPSRRNPELPAALDAVLLRGLARQPAARFAHAREMALELEATLPPATPHATAEWVAGAAAESFARRRLALARVETPGRWPARPTGAAAAPGERGVDDGTEGPTQLVASRARIGRAGWLVGATALLAGAVGVTWAALRPVDGLAPHQVDASAAGGHGSGAPSPASPPVDPRGSAEAPTTQGGAGTAPAPGEGGSSEGSRSGSALAVPSGAARDSAAPPTGRQAGSPPRKSGPTSCDPPYVVDAEGRRQVKRECL